MAPLKLHEFKPFSAVEVGGLPRQSNEHMLKLLNMRNKVYPLGTRKEMGADRKWVWDNVYSHLRNMAYQHKNQIQLCTLTLFLLLLLLSPPRL